MVRVARGHAGTVTQAARTLKGPRIACWPGRERPAASHRAGRCKAGPARGACCDSDAKSGGGGGGGGRAVMVFMFTVNPAPGPGQVRVARQSRIPSLQAEPAHPLTRSRGLDWVCDSWRDTASGFKFDSETEGRVRGPGPPARGGGGRLEPERRREGQARAPPPALSRLGVRVSEPCQSRPVAPP
jgi:hypothetical protein